LRKLRLRRTGLVERNRIVGSIRRLLEVFHVLIPDLTVLLSNLPPLGDCVVEPELPEAAQHSSYRMTVLLLVPELLVSLFREGGTYEGLRRVEMIPRNLQPF